MCFEILDWFCLRLHCMHFPDRVLFLRLTLSSSNIGASDHFRLHDGPHAVAFSSNFDRATSEKPPPAGND